MALEPSSRRTDVRQRTTLGSRFRLLLRVLGLTAILAAAAGAVLASTTLPAVETWTPELLRGLAEGAGDRFAQVSVWLLGGGVAVIALWLLVELLSGLWLVAGRKTLIGSNALAQIVLATALVLLVNFYSFQHYQRFDLTRDQQFTLPADLTEKLRKLRTDVPTTIVVLQLHKTGGTLSDKPDAYDYAAERKVVDKVRDLVDQLREFGPQFNVVVLDVEDERYERTLRELTRTRPGLAEVIRDAPENSIFFYADGKVRRIPAKDALLAGTTAVPDPADSGQSLIYPAAVTRMSFSEFYQLDKTASREASPAEREHVSILVGGLAFAPGVAGKGNLVLIPQGRDTFVRKVLALEDRQPRVALAVIHPYLTSREVFDEYSAAGLRKTLESNGFAVTDIILKKGWGGRGELESAADTYEENELDRAEARKQLFDALVADREQRLELLKKRRAEAVTAPLSELNRLFRLPDNRPFTSEDERKLVLQAVDETISLLTKDLEDLTKASTEANAKYQALLADERAAENRRITDVQAKLRQYVADADLLIVPRLTVLDIARWNRSGVIPPGLFNLSKEQGEVVREFVAAGKPVLFALGPTNFDIPGDRSDQGPDLVEQMLPRLGIELGRQTIITFKEEEAIAERQNETLGVPVQVPPLELPPIPEGGGARPANPLTMALQVTTRSIDRPLEIRRSGFRPVYLAPGFSETLPFAAEVFQTTHLAWNESRPLAIDDYMPKFEPPKPDDPRAGTRDEERRGPFPVGIAVKVPVPAEWVIPAPYPEQQQLAAILPLFDGGLSALGMTLVADKTPRPTVRILVYGHGGLFTGKQLSPGTETLLLHSVNWLLGRDDRLPQDAPESEKWRYPRVELSDRAYVAWRWGAFLGLPLVCIYLGLIVLMLRKIR